MKLLPHHLNTWPSNREYMDNPEGVVLFVRSGYSMEVSCLMQDFFVRDKVAYPPKDLDISASSFLPLSNPTGHSPG